MSVTLEITGLDELLEYLDTVTERLDSDWGLGIVIEKARRFAADISPVVSGSYRAAHKVMTGGNTAILFIDPNARNTTTGELVSRYAASVEERHKVYRRTYAYTQRLAAQSVDSIGDRLIA